MIKKIFFSIALLASWPLLAQQTGIKGVVTDKTTGETLIGATVLLQGTTTASSTDLNGNYSILDIAPGSYNLVVSYISYKTLTIPNIKIRKNETLELSIQIEPSPMNLEGVIVTATRRTNSDIATISSIRNNMLVANGVSGQMIGRTHDRDAAEVIRRIPGVTLMNDRFVLVRGLNQRYNSVLLNNFSTPSSEPDIRAFSFDLIPSSMIDNIMVNKSISPELPADFSGAAIQIFTKNNPDENMASLQYSTSFRPGITFNPFEQYRTSGLNWLGFDQGTLSLPKGVPAHLHTITDKEQLASIGRSFNKIWSPSQATALPDQRLQLAFARRFLLGKVSAGTSTAINYSYSQDKTDIFRADYQEYDQVKDKQDTSYYFNDNRYRTTAKLGALSNWFFVYGKNNKVEFRNLFNHIGYSQVLLRQGRDNYGGLTLHSEELTYHNRNIYSGQVTGENLISKVKTQVKWGVGYSYADRIQPDMKRVTSVLVEDPDNPDYGKYGVNLSFAASPDFCGRIYQDLKEHIYTAYANAEHAFEAGKIKIIAKSGLYAEKKIRSFSARNIGYAISNFSKFDWSLPYQPIETIFSDTNINNTTGIKIDETTNLSDSYTASNELIAGFLSLNANYNKWLTVFGGIRIENNIQQIHSFSSDNASNAVNVKVPETRLFPSINLAANLTQNSLVRASCGYSINRPEFREVAPFAFFDFEQKKLVRGNPALTNATIANYDLRYEYYHSPKEMVSAGVFLKHFNHPIETIEVNSGSGKDYTFQNAVKAINYGVEVEINKSLSFVHPNTLNSFWQKIFIVANAAYIHSQITVDTNLNYAEAARRPLQGQSPYIVNVGLLYLSDDLTASLQYNIFGKRIVVVGLQTPDVYEMPRHELDISVTKSFGKSLQIKLGLLDILDQEIANKQFITFTAKDGTTQKREQNTLIYRPGRVLSLGVNWKIQKQ